MSELEIDREEDNVPELAVAALTAAHRRAVQAGHPQVLVRNGQLVRITSSGITVLKQLPSRYKVAIRKKIVQ